MADTISEIIEKVIPYYKKKGGPEASHTLGYDSPTETLEPVYFWIIDLMTDFNLNPEKLIDNFSSSPGSGHFGELGQKLSLMQQQGTKILGDINTVLRSVLNLVYDLKDFRTRLQTYDDLKDKNKKDSAVLALKQIWMDKVDINKGNSSIKAMALGQAGFQTLIDAFLVAKDKKNADKLDLNERVKRIVIQRIHEFNAWLTQSEVELRKRYNIEKNYLKSQVNSLKIYSRWAKPYLRAAQKLEMVERDRSPALVKTFNSILLELSVLGKRKVSPPNEFRDMKLNREYYVCILIEFEFRGIPQRVSQQSHFTFGGKATVNFRSYSLNKDEIERINQELDKSDVEDAFRLIQGATTESLDELQKEIDSFLEEKPDEEKVNDSSGSNPFLALIGHYDKKPEKQETTKKKITQLKKDSWFEKEHLRPVAAQESKEVLFKLFNSYKKAHGMANFDDFVVFKDSNFDD